MTSLDINDALNNGVNSLFTISPTVTILVLANIVLLFFIRLLLIDAREERKLNREALNNSTAVISELKELIRGAISK